MPGPRSKYLKSGAAQPRARAGRLERAIPGRTEKSRRYLRLAVVNFQRASDADSPELKAKFLELATNYSEMALRIDDPIAWKAKLADDAKPRNKHY
jgi:hypothetical protein